MSKSDLRNLSELTGFRNLVNLGEWPEFWRTPDGGGVYFREALFKSDAKTPPRDLFWEHMGRKAVRRGDWKAVGFKNDWHLYDLQEDPTKLNDLASVV